MEIALCPSLVYLYGKVGIEILNNYRATISVFVWWQHFLIDFSVTHCMSISFHQRNFNLLLIDHKCCSDNYYSTCANVISSHYLLICSWNFIVQIFLKRNITDLINRLVSQYNYFPFKIHANIFNFLYVLPGVSGRYFDRLEEGEPSEEARDVEKRKKVWEASARLVGLNWIVY